MEKRLGEVACITMGQSPNSDYYNEDYDGIPLIQGNADIKNSVTIDRIYTINPIKVIEKDKLIMTVRAPVGELGFSHKQCCIGRGVCNIDSINDKFIFQYLKANDYKWKMFSQGSTFESVNSSDIKKFKLYLSDIDEQTKIGDFLSLIDKKIELEEKSLAKLNELKKGYMQKIFNQEIRFKDKNGNDYPEWKEKKLGDISDIITGNEDLKNKVENGKYPFFVRSNTIESINHYSFDGEAILIQGDGKIGDIYHYIDGKFNFHQRVYKISSNIGNIKLKYIYYYMMQFFKREALRNSVKATVDSLRIPTLQNFKVNLPSLPEQTKIANFLSKQDELIKKQEQKVALLKEQKKGLLQQMFV